MKFNYLASDLANLNVFAGYFNYLKKTIRYVSPFNLAASNVYKQCFVFGFQYYSHINNKQIKLQQTINSTNSFQYDITLQLLQQFPSSSN